MTRLPFLLALCALAAGCGSQSGPEPAPTATRAPSETPAAARVEVIATGLEVPWEIAFLPDGRALVTERPGRVRLLEAGGRLRDEPVAEIPVDPSGESGLMGLAVDPEFGANGLVYLYRTLDEGNQVVRYRFAGDGLSGEKVLVTGIEASAVHSGGRMHFGPDGLLYLSVGDAAHPSVAQDPGSLNGKILRMRVEDLRGDGPVTPEVFSLGHRNPQGFDWDPVSGRMVATEHGQSGNDEINVLRRGANYGWPVIEGDREQEGMVAPIHLYQSPSAPSGSAFVRRAGSAWTGDYLIAMLAGRRLQRLRLQGDEVVEDESMLDGRFGRLREVVEGPDGALYVLTSNRDGRSEVTDDDDDRIIRIVPPE